MKDYEVKLLTVGEACQLLHVTKPTLYAWEREGRISPLRTEGGHRRYNKTDLLNLVGVCKHKAIKKLTIAYCRVSTSSQKDDLERQIEAVSNYCIANGYQFKVIKDIGSGINYKKKGLQELINMICNHEVERIVINYKDRLVRFGYEMIEQLCDNFDVEIEIINQTNDISYEEELTEDVLSIITVFSARLYGSRSHKNKKIIETNEKLFHQQETIEEEP